MSRDTFPGPVVEHLLRLLLRVERREEMIGDLIEDARTRVVPRRGRFVARLWLLGEAARSLRHLVTFRDQTESGGRGITMRRARGVAGLTADVRYGLRRLLKHPTSTVAIVLTLALGVGLNASVFSLVNGLLFRDPAGVRQPERLVRIGRSYETVSRWDNFSWPSLLELRENRSVFEGVAGYLPTRITIGEGADAGEVYAVYVTGNYFGLLGVQTLLGRPILESDDRPPRGNSVAVLSHGLWMGRFGGDPGAVGTWIRIGSRQFQIVGVAAEAFRSVDPGEPPPQLYLPTATATLYGDHFPWGDWQAVWIRLVARLADGVSFDAAEAGLPLISSRLREARQGPEKIVVRLSRGLGLDPDDRAEAERASGLLFTVVGLVLLLACANMANLLLAKGLERSGEIGIRLALGASRSRIAAQLLVESVILGLLAAVVAVPLLYGVARFSSFFLPVDLSVSLLPDTRVFLFLLLLGAVTGVVFGAIPAGSGAGLDVGLVFRSGIGTGFRSMRYLQDSLVVVQLALAMGLLSGSVLLGRSILRARSADLGFDPRRLLAVSADPALVGRSDPTDAMAFYEGLTLGARKIHGVREATLASAAPFAGSPVQASVRTLESPPVEASFVLADLVRIGSGYFSTLGIPIVRGKGLQEGEREQVVIVNEAAAALLWGEENPLGRKLVVLGKPYEVMGIAGNARTVSLRTPARPAVFLPLASASDTRVMLLARTDVPPVQIVADLRTMISDLLPGLPPGRAWVVEQGVVDSIRETRTLGWLLSGLAVLSLLLSSVGLFGLVSHGVSRRIPELGVRMALGASPGDVVWMVLARGLALSGTGAILGLGVALLVGQGLRAHLFAISPVHVGTLSASALILVITGLVATWIPAYRAARLDASRSLKANGA